MQSLLKRIQCISRNEKGFTLVELIVVVAIIAILTAVLLPKLLGYTDNARESRAKGDLASMKSVIEAYAASEGNGKYPADADAAKTLLAAHGINTPTDPWGNPYNYAASTNQDSYIIISFGRDGAQKGNDDMYVTESISPTKDTGNTAAAPSGGTLQPIK
ncbi:MAG: type II secretion system protein GspG [Thermoanaerobacteraceae bacterium]|nr:type II secretion system protein GspG [Thermoanaerobacteraceae bacterium]